MVNFKLLLLSELSQKSRNFIRILYFPVAIELAERVTDLSLYLFFSVLYRKTQMSLCETHAPVQDTQPVKMGIAFCLIYTNRDTLWRPVPTLLSKWSNMTVDLTQAALQGQLMQFCSPAQLAFLREYRCKHLAWSIPIVEWVHTPTLLLRDAAVHTSSRAVPWQRPLTLNFWKMARKVTFLVCHGQLPLLYECISHCILET